MLLIISEKILIELIFLFSLIVSICLVELGISFENHLEIFSAELQQATAFEVDNELPDAVFSRFRPQEFDRAGVESIINRGHDPNIAEMTDGADYTDLDVLAGIHKTVDTITEYFTGYQLSHYSSEAFNVLVLLTLSCAAKEGFINRKMVRTIKI